MSGAQLYEKCITYVERFSFHSIRSVFLFFFCCNLLVVYLLFCMLSHLTVRWIGFCHTGPISLCINLFVFIGVYYVCFCFILHILLYYCEHGGVDLVGLKPNP